MARHKNDGMGRLGGRAKGTPNKKTQELMDKAEELGADPYTVLLLFTKNDHEALGYDKHTVVGVSKSGEAIEGLTISPELRAQCARDACQYIYPKRKAVELSQDADNPVFAPLSREEIIDAIKNDPFFDQKDK
jgi:hypothetical protein